MKLMLIGGGDNGHGNTSYETKEIDEEIVKMTNKENPIFLFIGLASNFSDSYYDVMKNIYQKLGCETLYLKKKNIVNNPNIAKEKIQKADIIYMSGGDTNKLVTTIKEYHLKQLLLEALNKNCVISGISAGAIAISKSGLSDYLILNNLSDKYAFIDGLIFLNLNICPHSDKKERLTDLKELLKNTNQKVIALDNQTAIKFDNNKYTIIKSNKSAQVKLLYWENNVWQEIKINNRNINKILNNLTNDK